MMAKQQELLEEDDVLLQLCNTFEELNFADFDTRVKQRILHYLADRFDWCVMLENI